MEVGKTGTGLRLYKGRWPSVTTVLKVIEKSHLDDWRARVGHREADRVMRSAQVLGTRVHSYAERVFRGEHIVPEDEYALYVDALQAFMEEWVDEVISTEQTLISETRKFAGTLDLYIKVKDSKGGGYAVVDLKTTRSLTRDHGLQTAAYALLLRDNGHPIHRRLVCRIKKEDGARGKYHVREYKDHALDARAFVALLVVFYWQKQAQIDKLMAEAEGKTPSKPKRKAKGKA